MKRFDERRLRRRRHCIGVAILLFLGPLSAPTLSERSAASAGDPLARLMAGNARFVKGALRATNYKQERRELIKGQHPYAIILSCSDSRVAPEIVFDESLGKLFVVRVAGNVVDPATLGSVEYAAEHLHTKLLFVLGHESCGAVRAAVEGGHFSPSIQSIVERINPAVAAAKRETPNAADILPLAISKNVGVQIKSALEQSEILKELVAKDELRIAGGVYGLGTGKVDLVSTNLTAPNH